MTDQELKDLVASIAVYQRENELRSKETDRQLRELGKQIGGLGDKFGSFTEGLALPSMARILDKRFGMKVIAPRVRARNNGRSMEVDVLAYSDDRDEIFVVEVKSHLREDGLDQMRKTLRDFHEFFPGHKDKKLFGILAAVDAPRISGKKSSTRASTWPASTTAISSFRCPKTSSPAPSEACCPPSPSHPRAGAPVQTTEVSADEKAYSVSTSTSRSSVASTALSSLQPGSTFTKSSR